MPFAEITVDFGQAPNKNIWLFEPFLLPIYLIENAVHDEAKFAQSRKVRHGVGGRVKSRSDT